VISDKHLDNSLRYQAANGRILGLVGVEADADGRIAPAVVSAGGGTVGVGVSASNADSAVRQTTLTLVDVVVEVVSVTTGAGVGGTVIFTFPANQVQFLGCVSDLAISVATANQADFTDATPEGDIGIGSLAPANADALGTDATDDDYGTAEAFTMASFVDPSVVNDSEAGALLAASAEVLINVLVDAVDIDDGVTTEVLINGTVTLTWANLA
jgi:hypothetical protein